MRITSLPIVATIVEESAYLFNSFVAFDTLMKAFSDKLPFSASMFVSDE